MNSMEAAAAADMADLFDFSAASMQEEVPKLSSSSAAAGEKLDEGVGLAEGGLASPAGFVCPAHPGRDDCLCHGFMGDFEVPEGDAFDPTTEPFQDFSTYIPRYSKPDQSCDYCRSKQLECFMTFEGQTACVPCNALFRPCSFNTAASELPPRGAIDTLHVVDEDLCTEIGMLTKYKHLRSLAGLEGSAEKKNASEKKGAVRFSRQAIKILKDWVEEHHDHPYPSDEEKEALKVRTGLSVAQVSNWLANARRRGKVHPKRSLSPSRSSSSGSSCPIDIKGGLPAATTDKAWETLNPFERWRHSPPENEPASTIAIVDAMVRSPLDIPANNTLTSSSPVSRHRSGENSSNHSVLRAPSSTSMETSIMSSGSTRSRGSAWSHGSRNSYNSFHSFGSAGKKQSRRRRRMATKQTQAESEAPRLFQCTFCTDTFKNKHDWSRHEKSLHLSLEKWICAPLGHTIVDPASGRKMCVYCETLDPTDEHLDEHNHETCESKGMAARTFYRKDHLRQHLRLVHHCKMTPSMDSWKSELSFLKSRCGFCGEEFTKWQDRADHLSRHFRSGYKMSDWKGCRGLDPVVAAQVTHSMPPYLIAIESRSPFPFSASNESSMRNHARQAVSSPRSPMSPTASVNPLNTSAMDIDPPAAMYPIMDPSQTICPAHISPATSRTSIEQVCLPQDLPSFPITSPSFAGIQTSSSSNVGSSALPSAPIVSTCWEILTIRLGRYARDYVEANNGVPPTDDQLQVQARWILYESDDDWNQTAADNPEWLSLFKRAHGIDGTGNAPDLGTAVCMAPSSVAEFDTLMSVTGGKPTTGATAMEKADMLEDLGIGAGVDLSELLFETALGDGGMMMTSTTPTAENATLETATATAAGESEMQGVVSDTANTFGFGF